MLADNAVVDKLTPVNSRDGDSQPLVPPIRLLHFLTLKVWSLMDSYCDLLDVELVAKRKKESLLCF